MTPPSADSVLDSRQENCAATSPQERRRMVAILPRGESLRNFVYTGALDELAQSVDVSILSVMPNDSFRDLLTSRYPDVSALKEERERWPVRFLREVLDLAHGRWLWSEAARLRWAWREHDANTPARWLKRAGKKLACYPFANRPGLELLSRMEHAAGCLLRTSDEYLRYFRERRPSLVFNSSHIHSVVALQAVRAAKQLGIPTATFLFSWDNLTSQGRIIPTYDHYIVWNEKIRGELLDIYRNIRPEQVFVTGTPQFDFHYRPEYYWTREEFCRRVGADPARPIIVYSTGTAYQMPDEPLIVERIADMLKGMPGNPQFLVRVYAKDRTDRFDELKNRRPDILFPPVPWEKTWWSPTYEDCYVLTNTLRHCALGINVASTVSLELCMFDKPVVNVGYNPPGKDVRPVDYARYYQFDHYRPLTESGALWIAYSEEQIRAQIIEALTHPERKREERKNLIRNFFGDTLDGKSSSRVAQVLQKLAQST